MKNIGLVGLGFIGKTHLEAYKQIENGQVTAICTTGEVSDEEITNNDKVYVTSDFENLLSDKTIDIIDICLPTFLHEEFIIKAANAGKHIICEKPLTLSMESADRILKAVHRNGVHLFVGHLLRFWPEYQIIKAYSETNMLEEIEIVHAKRLGQFPKWSKWFKDPEKSGGALFDLHIHDIDFVYYLLGEVDSVSAVGLKNEYGAWDHVITTLTFKNGSKAYVEASQRMPTGYPFTMSLRAQTPEKALDFTISAGENIESVGDSIHELIYYSDGKKTEVEVEQKDAFQNELSYFVNCIENNQENRIIPIKDVMYILTLLKSIEKSLVTGEKVYI
ncbi:Gfo/Idh/MocA family protein [Evansella tamaricis]|uniref:Gfo/Idh/MocA family oxidoreductase n=1 Tax=Evansella tamaricis TaxID=2069301 RepID=A0ABS6JGL8_9BACI|nr:Gfo/Idh/MocA family oxidoreductase [Evansella tamaricis]MBU9711982.1 Gfo/Idh/MocA family oxidoreductase [Evansella tamaricis]